MRANPDRLHRLGRLSAALLFLGLLATGPAAQAAGSVEHRVRQALVKGWMESGWGEERTVRRLSDVGSEAIPVLFDIAAGERQELFTDIEVSSWDLERGPDSFGEIARLALRALPRRDVLDHAEGVLKRSPSYDQRIVVSKVLADLGSGDDLDLLFRTVRGFVWDDLRTRAVRLALAEAFAGVLSDGPVAFDEFEHEMDSLSAEQAEVVGRILLEVSTPAAFGVLPTLLEDGKGDVAVISRLADLREAYPWATEVDADWVSRTVAGYLKAEDWRLRRAAAVALARMYNRDAVDMLLFLMEFDPHPSVQRAARWGMQQISGTTLTLEVDGWRTWLEEQALRWDDEGQTLMDGLRSEDPAIALQSARGLLGFPLQRHVVATLLPDVLFDHPQLTPALCDMLRRLGSQHSVPALVDALGALGDEQELLVWRVLKGVTGADLPPDVAVWAAFVSS